MLSALISLSLTLLFAELSSANFKRLAPVLEAWDQFRKDPNRSGSTETIRIDPTNLLWVGGWEKLAAIVWAFGNAIPLIAFAAASYLFLEGVALSGNFVLGAAIGSNVIALSIAFGLILLSGPVTFFRVRTMTSPVFLLLATVAFAYVALNGNISPWEGIILLFLIVAYGFYFRRFSGEWKYYERGHADISLVESSEGILPMIAVVCMGVGFFFLSVLVAFPLVTHLGQIAIEGPRDPFRIGAHLVALGLSLPWLFRAILSMHEGPSAKAMTLTSISHSCLLNLLLLPGIAAFFGLNELSPNLISWYLPILILFTGIFVSALLVEKESGGKLTWILILSYLLYTGAGLLL